MNYMFTERSGRVLTSLASYSRGLDYSQLGPETDSVFFSSSSDIHVWQIYLILGHDRLLPHHL
jgi:tryptophan synthase beta subunit